MELLFKLKSLRLGYSILSSTFASKLKGRVANPKRADSILALVRNHGLPEAQLSKFVMLHPEVLLANPEQTLLLKLQFFISLGVSNEDLAKTLALCPQIFSRSLEKEILPDYNFLRSLIPEKKVVFVLKGRSWFFFESLSGYPLF
ncbi:hypothetical protein L3X38_002469 [Prunus dulcis]|uniref:Mitochondrial transcription termination factor family protein n=1 Tax=Prunus dulcis TaxID=3755 RepID=A0AAD4ZL36_PRUDU|nr:hypothetical protein L3X38_002469 [Prunus dulcis]